jgi:hypothetical protein
MTPPKLLLIAACLVLTGCVKPETRALLGKRCQAGEGGEWGIVADAYANEVGRQLVEVEFKKSKSRWYPPEVLRCPK